VVSGGQSMNPSTQELVAAVEKTGAQHVIILPNNKNIVAVAQQVNALVSASVVVVPTVAVVQGLAAMMHYDGAKELGTNEVTMNAGREATISAEVTQAVRDTESAAGSVRVGDWIGLGELGIQSVDESLVACATKLLASAITPGVELLTILEGEGADPGTTRLISEFVVSEHPAVDVEVHHGGQALYPYFFGLE
jgi:dihydroxyacetone kinase-like predicted kinase